MIKAQRRWQIRTLALPFARSRAARSRKGRAPWLRALAAGLAGLGEQRVAPFALTDASPDQRAARRW